MKKPVIIVSVLIVFLLAFFWTSYNLLDNQSKHLVVQSCSGKAKCFSGTVTRIIDGDTIVVGATHVRFALVAAPELSESGGQMAKELVENLCPVGSKALVDEDDGQTGGSYGRTIAKIYCNDILLNEALVSKGIGYVDKRFCTRSEFATERWAQQYGC